MKFNYIILPNCVLIFVVFSRYFKVAQRGEVKQVKILGAIALIDEGETDWKILTIDITDPLADKINGMFDVKAIFFIHF